MKEEILSFLFKFEEERLNDFSYLFFYHSFFTFLIIFVHTHRHTHILIHSLTHTHSKTNTHTNKNTFSLSLSLSLSLFLSFFLSFFFFFSLFPSRYRNFKIRRKLKPIFSQLRTFAVFISHFLANVLAKLQQRDKAEMIKSREILKQIINLKNSKFILAI